MYSPDTVTVERPAIRRADLPERCAAETDSNAAVARSPLSVLPDGPMQTPNARLVRTILREKEAYLPRFLAVLKETAPRRSFSNKLDAGVSPHRLSWVIHLLAAWNDPIAFPSVIRHFSSPLPYAQDDGTWMVSRLPAALTVPRLSSNVLRNAGESPHAVDACVVALARTAFRLGTSDDDDELRLQRQAIAAIELLLHREESISPERLMDAAAFLAALKSESAWARILDLFQLGHFQGLGDDRRDIYYLHELYDGRREHGLLFDLNFQWLAVGDQVPV